MRHPRLKYRKRVLIRRRVFRKLILDRQRIAAGNCKGGYNPELYFRFLFGKTGPSGSCLWYPKGRVIADTWPRWMGRPRDTVKDKRYWMRRKTVTEGRPS